VKKVKILTDIKIMQSPIWQKKTNYVEDIDPKLTKIFNKLSDRLPLNLKAFFNFILIIKHMKGYDVIITANIKTGQMIALFKKLLNIKSTRQIILELMLDEEVQTIKWKIKRMIQKFIFSSMDIIFVSSTREVKTYSRRFNLPENQFKFLHFHTNITEPRIIQRPNSYILSAGRTGRDYHTLAEAVRGLPVEVVFICDSKSIKGVSLPENVKLFINIPREQYLELIKNCRFVVVPLEKRVKSTGQVVILEAMAFGKPVIATDTVGTMDYITHKQTGMLVSSKDSVSLKNAILELLNNQSLQNTISVNAFKFIKEDCTFERYVTNILEVAENITSRKDRPYV